MTEGTTMTAEREAIEIIQADRDAAADYWKGLVNMPELQAMRDGKRDDHWKIQQLAHERTTSLAAQDGLVDALESTLRYSLWNDAMVRQGMTQDEAIKHVSDTVAAIKGDKS